MPMRSPKFEFRGTVQNFRTWRADLSSHHRTKSPTMSTVYTYKLHDKPRIPQCLCSLQTLAYKPNRRYVCSDNSHRTDHTDFWSSYCIVWCFSVFLLSSFLSRQRQCEAQGLLFWTEFTSFFCADYSVAKCVSIRVCLSVTRRYSVETTKHVLKLFHRRVTIPF